MTKLILIRHGQTDWNFKKRYSGFTNIGLNDKGKREAKKLHQNFKKEEIHKVYSSDRKRAIQTAQIVFREKAIEKVPHLREMHFGVFEGLTYAEIMKKYPLIYKQWLKNPYSITMPKGEGMREFKKRVISAFGKIIAMNKNKTIAVVCHGGAISIFLNHILKSRDFWKQIPASGSITIVECKNGKAKIR